MTEFDGFPLPESTRHASVPVRLILLADGRLWGLALPTPRYRPEVVPGMDPWADGPRRSGWWPEPAIQ